MCWHFKIKVLEMHRDASNYGQYFQKGLKISWQVYFPFLLYSTICDMIKRNESDVGNIDFELQAKRDDKFLC